MKDKLLNLLAEAKIKKVLDELMEITKHLDDKDLHKQTITINAQFAEYKRNKRLDQSRHEDNIVTYSKIINSTTEIINLLPEKLPTSKNTKKKKYYFWLFLIPPLCIILVVSYKILSTQKFELYLLIDSYPGSKKISCDFYDSNSCMLNVRKSIDSRSYLSVEYTVESNINGCWIEFKLDRTFYNDIIHVKFEYPDYINGSIMLHDIKTIELNKWDFSKIRDTLIL